MATRAMRSAFVVIVLLVAVLSFAGKSYGQTVSGSISGTAVDSSGAVIPDAQVRAIHVATGSVATTKTDGAGLFQFSGLATGTYSVEFTKQGFSKFLVNNVEVSAGGDQGLGSVKLEVGASTVTVEVTEAPPLLESTQAQVSTTFTTQQITSFAGAQENEGLDVLALQLPGVNNTRDNTFSNSNGPGFSVNGIRGRNNDQQIDGQNNNDNSVAGPSLFLSNPDFVQEYEITTNNFGPEYGRNGGSVVNLVTPSGTNTWHGNISGAEGNAVLDSLTNTDKAPFNTLTRVPWFNNAFASTTVGGAVKKDHVFVFGGFDTQIVEQNALDQNGSLTPTPTGLGQLAACYPNSASVAALRTFGPYGIGGGNPSPIPGTDTSITLTGSNTSPACAVDFAGVQRFLGTPFHEYDFISRADFQYGNDRVYLRYIYNKSNSIDADPFGTAAAGYPASVPSLSQNALIGWTHTISSSMTNELRIGYGRQNTEFGGNSIGNTVPLQGAIGTALSSIGVSSTDGNPIVTFGPANNAPQGRIVNTYQIQDNWSYVHGKSQWKAGVNFTYQKSPNVFLPNFNGSYTFGAVPVTNTSAITTPDCTIPAGVALNAFSAFACNVPTTINISQGNPTLDFKEKDTFLYVGNDYKLRPNLTINLGLTWSYYGQPANIFHDETLKNQTSATPLWNPALPTSVTTFPSIPAPKNSWGPSVGFAWSPNWDNSFLRFLGGSSGKTVVRGGYRLSYDPPFYNIYLNIASSSPVLLAQTLSNAAAVSNPLLADPNGVAVRAQLGPSLITGVSDPRSFNQTGLTPNFGPDHVHSWSLGVQRELSSAAAVEVRYVGNHGSNLFQSVNANPFIADLAAGFPSFIPAGDTPCPTGSAVVPKAVGRVNCDEGVLRNRTNTGYSDYSGLQAQFRATNLYKQLTMTANYTWSKTTDNVSEIFGTNGGGNTLAFSQNPLNFTSAEHGLSGLNIPQAFSLNAFEQFPFFRSQSGWIGHLLGGWGVSGNYILSSGEPYTPSQIFTNFFSGGVGSDEPFDAAFIGTFETSRPFIGSLKAPVSQVGIFAGDACALDGGMSCTVAPTTLLSFNAVNQTGDAGTPVTVTSSAVRFIANGGEAQTVFGTPFGAGRNIVRDGATNISNISIFKTFKINERGNVQFHATMLNAFNHSNYSTVDPFIDDAGLSSFETGFGVPALSPNGGSFGRRQVLFGVKINF
jgi:carboxypeptidase family protein